MSATALLSQLRSSGVALKVKGDKIRWQAPCGVMTPELRREIVKLKPEIVTILHEREVSRREERRRLIGRAREVQRQLIDRHKVFGRLGGMDGKSVALLADFDILEKRLRLDHGMTHQCLRHPNRCPPDLPTTLACTFCIEGDGPDA